MINDGVKSVGMRRREINLRNQHIQQKTNNNLFFRLRALKRTEDGSKRNVAFEMLEIIAYKTPNNEFIRAISISFLLNL